MPDPAPPVISGWQHVILECVRTLVPVGLALIALWQADKATDRANDARHQASEARVYSIGVGKVLGMKGPE